MSACLFLTSPTKWQGPEGRDHSLNFLETTLAVPVPRADAFALSTVWSDFSTCAACTKPDSEQL